MRAAERGGPRGIAAAAAGNGVAVQRPQCRPKHAHTKGNRKTKGGRPQRASPAPRTRVQPVHHQNFVARRLAARQAQLPQPHACERETGCVDDGAGAGRPLGRGGVPAARPQRARSACSAPNTPRSSSSSSSLAWLPVTGLLICGQGREAAGASVRRQAGAPPAQRPLSTPAPPAQSRLSPPAPLHIVYPPHTHTRLHPHKVGGDLEHQAGLASVVHLQGHLAGWRDQDHRQARQGRGVR